MNEWHYSYILRINSWFRNMFPGFVFLFYSRDVDNFLRLHCNMFSLTYAEISVFSLDGNFFVLLFFFLFFLLLRNWNDFVLRLFFHFHFCYFSYFGTCVPEISMMRTLCCRICYESVWIWIIRHANLFICVITADFLLFSHFLSYTYTSYSEYHWFILFLYISMIFIIIFIFFFYFLLLRLRFVYGRSVCAQRAVGLGP